MKFYSYHDKVASILLPKDKSFIVLSLKMSLSEVVIENELSEVMALFIKNDQNRKLCARIRTVDCIYEDGDILMEIEELAGCFMISIGNMPKCLIPDIFFENLVAKKIISNGWVYSNFRTKFYDVVHYGRIIDIYFLLLLRSYILNNKQFDLSDWSVVKSIYENGSVKLYELKTLFISNLDIDEQAFANGFEAEMGNIG
jgi:hypothetical protein